MSPDVAHKTKLPRAPPQYPSLETKNTQKMKQLLAAPLEGKGGEERGRVGGGEQHDPGGRCGGLQGAVDRQQINCSDRRMEV